MIRLTSRWVLTAEYSLCLDALKSIFAVVCLNDNYSLNSEQWIANVDYRSNWQ